MYQQTLTQGCAEGIHHEDLPVGICFPQIIGCNDRRLVSGGQGRGEGHGQHIPSLFQGGLHEPCPVIGIGCGGGGHGTLAQFLVKSLHGSGVGKIAVVFSLVHHRQIGADNIILLQLFFCKVAAGIGNNLIAHFIHSVILD